MVSKAAQFDGAAGNEFQGREELVRVQLTGRAFAGEP